MTFAKRIKSARLAANLTQEKLAQAISSFGDGEVISRAAIAQWESGATKNVEATNLFKAAKVLDVNPEWLLFGTDKMKLSRKITCK